MKTFQLLSTLASVVLFAATTTAQASDDGGNGDRRDRARSFDVCTDPGLGFHFDDADGDLGFSAGDGFTAVGIVLPAGTIPSDGFGVPANCSTVADQKIGTFLARGRLIIGSAAAAPDDLGYDDWHFRIDNRGSFDTTGVVKIAFEPLSTYSQNVVGGTGVFRDLEGRAGVLILDGANGFQMRIRLPHGDDDDDD